METAAIILAAGKGTRMRSRLSKVLHPLAGRPMILHIAETVASLRGVVPVYVLGHEADQVRAALDPAALWVLQAEQRGTGHGVRTALPALPAGTRQVLILYGDVPLLQPATLRALLRAHEAAGAVLTLVTAVVDDPHGYGRIVRAAEGDRIVRIVEQKELAPGQEAIREINCGIYCVDAPWLSAAMDRLHPHPDGELYLTDLVADAAGYGDGVGVHVVPSAIETLGINTRVQLAQAEAIMRARINEALMLGGVTMIDPASTYIDVGARIGADTVIHPQTYIRGATEIGADCVIGPGTTVVASRIGARCRVVSSVVEGALIADDVSVGPFAHLRAGAELAEHVEVGNYAEVKNARLGPRTKMHHVGYVGDATIGGGVNIGADTIVCNYDGRQKHHTTVGDGAFVGSGTLLRAPVHLGRGSVTGAGAVVLHDVPEGTTVAGVPARPIPSRGEGAE